MKQGTPLNDSAHGEQSTGHNPFVIGNTHEKDYNPCIIRIIVVWRLKEFPTRVGGLQKDRIIRVDVSFFPSISPKSRTKKNSEIRDE